jgi:hypothetical protein
VAQQQLGLFQPVAPADEKLREKIREIDINRTTPIEALQFLQDLKRDVDG